MTTRILALVGSLRSASISRQLAETAAHVAPAGVEFEIFDGLDQVPFYNEDIDDHDAPLPAVAKLRTAAAEADAVLLVTPEYNGTIPAVLKNAIDWLSRPYGAGAITAKPVAVIAGSITPYGAKWALEHSRKAVEIAGGTVIDTELSIAGTGEKFGDQHPREHVEVAEQIGAVVRALVGASEELVATR